MLQIIDLQCMHLSGVNLTVEASECISISGPSGCGKTTLLRALADLDEHHGQVFCQGVAQQDIPAHEWRRRVAYLPSESAWWFDTVAEHFDEIDNELFAMLNLRENIVDALINHLSSGERQRLSLLRLLSKHPQVLLLDEPTANLDATTRAAVEAVIENYRLSNFASVIWVGHDVNQLTRVATRHFVVNAQDKQIMDAPWAM